MTLLLRDISAVNRCRSLELEISKDTRHERMVSDKQLIRAKLLVLSSAEMRSRRECHDDPLDELGNDALIRQA
jgi:hypothetical protein